MKTILRVMQPSRRRPGFTVLETIVAVFILVAATALSGKMLGISLRASGTVRDEATALLLAEQRFHVIERWSREGGRTTFNFNDDDVWPVDGQPFDLWPFKQEPDKDHPDFLVSATSRKQRVQTPFAGRGQTFLDASARVVQVTVTWGKADMRARTISITGLITEPFRPLASIALTPDSLSALGRDPVTVTAQGLDPAGEPIPDLVYRWDVVSLSGNITVKVTPGTRGAEALLSNVFVYPDGRKRHTGGRCRVRVRATCGGRELTRALELDLGAAGDAE